MAPHGKWWRCLVMWQLLGSLLCLGFVLATHQSTKSYCYTDDTNPYHEFATKTPYNYSRGEFHLSNLVPEGCVAAQAWHIIRHGTRYPKERDIRSFVSELPDLQIAVLKAHREGQGSLCEGDLSLLSEWSLGGLNASWALMLTTEGEQELRGLASRYKDALPSLLDQHFSNDSFKFRHTASQRTEASAKAYSEALFGDAPVYIPPGYDPDPLLKFYDVCMKYKAEVEDNPAALRESRLFWEGSEMEGVRSNVSRRLGFSCTRDQLELLYDACRFYQAWHPARSSPWCVSFTPYDLKVLEYASDLKHYYTAGYGYDINTAMACPPLQDVYQHFSDLVRGKKGPRGIFYFTHSKALNTVMSRLGLYHDAAPLTHYHINPERLWRTSYHTAFATNLAFTLSKCNGDRWWVSIASSERMVALQGCEGGKAGCSWRDFSNVLSSSLNCDLNSICDVTHSGCAGGGGGGGAERKGWTAVLGLLLLHLSFQESLCSYGPLITIVL